MFSRRFGCQWTRIASAAFVLALVAGCEMGRCPEGMVPDSKQGHCVALSGDADAVETPDPQADAEVEPNAAGDADAQSTNDPGARTPDAKEGEGPGSGDAAPAVGPETATLDAGIAPDAAVPTDAAQGVKLDGDAGRPAQDALVDANPSDTGTAAELACDHANLSRFREFQRSEAMIDAAVACGGSLASCLQPGCEIARCIRAQAGVKVCGACIEAEARCVAKQCSDECGPNGTPDRCLACSCYARCFDTGGACGATPIDLCARCARVGCEEVPMAVGGFQAQENLTTTSRSALQPVAITRGRGSVEVMWITDQGTLEYTQNSPSGPRGLGTTAADVGAPPTTALTKGSLAVAAWGNGPADIVARGADKRLWHRKLESLWLPTWGPWETPSTDVPLREGDRLAIETRGPHLTDAVFAGEDGNVYHVSWSAGASVVTSLGAPPGVKLRGPHLASDIIDSLDVVARGDDARLYHKRWQPGGWSEWQNPCGAVMSGLPWLATNFLRTMHVFWRKEQPDGSGSLKACLRVAGGWAPADLPLAPNGHELRATDSDLGLDLSVFPSSLLAYQGGARSRNQTLLTYAMVDQLSYWFHGFSSAELGPYPVTFVGPGRYYAVWVFGTLQGSIGAIAWRLNGGPPF